MPPPVPLTACDPPLLDWSRPSAPVASDYGDIYFSVEGGLAETEAVFLKGCGLPDAWQGRKSFIIGELGFGSGLNFLAAWRLWEQSKLDGGRLHFISIEKHPFDKAALSRALEMWPELKVYASRLIELWPGRVKGFHILHVAPDVTLTLVHDDIELGLTQVAAKVDAWFLDGFSPAKNPAMWSEEVMGALARLSAPGARVGTFTVAGAVRQALRGAGFEVEKKKGFGRKRHRLEAVYPGTPTLIKRNVKPIIIGAGIAGASLARSFLRRNILPTVIDAQDGTAASGNPVAIVKPRLDIQDRPESRFFLASYLYALRAYDDGGKVVRKGVFHAAKSQADETRFEKLAQNAALSHEHMISQSGPYDTHGLYFPRGQVIDPVKTCAKFLQGAERVAGRVSSIEMVSDGVAVLDTDGLVLATGTHVFFAIGAGVKAFSKTKDMPLRFSRGQITPVEMSLGETLTYGGYAIPHDGSVVLGATHARLTEVNPYLVTDEDDAENIQKLVDISGVTPLIIAGESRASVRVTTMNTLPLVANLFENVTVLTGLGSRGFVFAPLLAEDLVADVCGEPAPLSKQQRLAFRRERNPT